MDLALPSDFDLDAVAHALRAAAHVPYAPPHVYPMAAPQFVKSIAADRPHPTPGPIGVYLHIPFCNYSCSFCFYAKRVGDDRALMGRYVKALKRELTWIESGTPLLQLFVGGGTPTALPADLLDEVLAAVMTRMPRGSSYIHTVESSPESITPEHVRVFLERGIGRVSIGVQTLSGNVLDTVHRHHGRQEALTAIDLLLSNGLIVNVDLIYGLPGQTADTFRGDFETIVARGVHSLTAYNLRINERTPVVQAIADAERLDLDRLVRWRALVRDLARELGLRPTRWHTFQRPELGFRDMTSLGHQFGAGISARSRIDDVVYRNHTNMDAYLERVERGRSPVEEVFPAGPEQMQTLYISLTLGEAQALQRDDYSKTFGRTFDDDFAEPLERMRDAGLVHDDGASVSLSPAGELVHDLVTLAFYPRPVQSWLNQKHDAALAKKKTVVGL